MTCFQFDGWLGWDSSNEIMAIRSGNAVAVSKPPASKTLKERLFFLYRSHPHLAQHNDLLLVLIDVAPIIHDSE